MRNEKQLPPLIPQDGRIRLVPLGGCGEFGMNMTLFLFQKKAFLIDCGIMFPEESKLGVETVFPRIEALLNFVPKIEAYIITHGHEDHIGALPFVYQWWKAPLYAPSWARGLIERKFDRHGLKISTPLHTIEDGDVVDGGVARFEYVQLNHSIPDACALMIDAGGKKIFHTGDFKLDAQAIGEKPYNRDRLISLGKRGIDLLLCDSTNAQLEGRCPGEASVEEPLKRAFSQVKGAVIVTTFASNLWRLITIVRTAHAQGRRVLALGSGLLQCLEMARERNLLDDLPKGVWITEAEYLNIPRENLCVMATGSQGESRAVIARLASGEQRNFSLEEGDGVIFSSRTIPGNERVVQMLMADLEKRGVTVFSARTHPGIHVSGHAYREEVKEMLTHLAPRYFVPIHGTFSHLKANARNALDPAFDLDGIVDVEDGSILDLKEDGALVQSKELFPLESLYVDSESNLPLEYSKLRERLKVGEQGLVVISAAISGGQLAAPLSFDLRGVAGADDAFLEKLSEATHGYVEATISNAEVLEEAEENLRLFVRKKFFQAFKKKPVVIAVIHKF